MSCCHLVVRRKAFIDCCCDQLLRGTFVAGLYSTFLMNDTVCYLVYICRCLQYNFLSVCGTITLCKKRGKMITSSGSRCCTHTLVILCQTGDAGGGMLVILSSTAIALIWKGTMHAYNTCVLFLWNMIVPVMLFCERLYVFMDYFRVFISQRIMIFP